MIKTIIRAIYSAFISIVLISIILASWTFFAFIFQPTKSGEIINVIQNMYKSQKSVVISVFDLSKLLIKDSSELIPNDDNNLLIESEFLIDQEDKFLNDETSIMEDKGDNPLGIVIEPSLPEVGEENLPGISEEPLDNNQTKVSMNAMEIEMDIN